MTDPDANGWRPIETAPKHALAGDVSVLVFTKERRVDTALVGWTDLDGSNVWWNGEYVVEPTHWQPMPAPPEDARHE